MRSAPRAALRFDGAPAFRAPVEPAPSFRQQLQGVRAINLHEYVVGQVESVDVPTPLPRRVRWVLKVLVRGLEKTKVEPVHPSVREKIGSEQDAIGEAQEEAPRGIGLPAKLRRTGADINVHIRVRVQEPRNIFKILGTLG